MSCCEKKLSFDLTLFAIIIFALNNFQIFSSCLLVWVYLGCFIIIILFIYIYNINIYIYIIYITWLNTSVSF